MKKRIVSLIVLNGCFLAYFAHYVLPMDAFVFSVVVNLILFLLPGIAWSGILPGKCFQEDIVAYSVGVFFLSFVILLSSLIGHLLLNIQITAFSHCVYLLIVVNGGVLLREINFPKRNIKSVLCLFFLVYLTAYFFSARVMNTPLQDSDWDLQGTAYGLMHDLKPRMATDRHTIHDFSHPPVSHFSTASTILFFNQLEGVKHFYDTAFKVEEVYGETPVVGQEIDFVSKYNNETKSMRITAVEGDVITFTSEIPQDVFYDWHRMLPSGRSVDLSSLKKMKAWQLVQGTYAQFYRTPYLASTRNSYYVFTALAAVVLFALLLNLSGSYFMSIFGCLLYLTIPEVLISASSTNHWALTSFIMIAGMYLHMQFIGGKEDDTHFGFPLFLAGFLCPMINHKTLILIPVVVISLYLYKGQKKTFSAILSIIFRDRFIWGYGVGYAVFWLYGLGIDAQAFLTDHFYTHFLDRILHNDVLGRGEYPSVFTLWKMYVANVGPLLFGIGLFAIIRFFPFSTKNIEKKSVLSLWFLSGSLAFSVVDHLGTNNLGYSTAALIVLSVVLVSQLSGIMKKIVMCCLIVGILVNTYILFELVFRVRSPFPIISWI